MTRTQSEIREQILVSVVIPCLNRADFLQPTIESVLQQDYPHIECIVVDGGSTDETVAILKCYEDRISWISEPDDGHADAINKGWQMSKGEVLAWLNADDVWAVPDAVREAVAYLSENPEVDLVYGDCGSIDAEGNLVGMSYLHQWDLAYAVEHCDHCIPQPAAFIRRQILEKVGWLDKSFFQKKDHELWLRIGVAGNIKYLPRVLAHARNTKGLSFHGKTAAPACIQVTKKFYSIPDIPNELRSKKRRSMSNSYLKGTHYAFAGGRHWKMILTYCLHAACTDPTNLPKTLRSLRYYMAIGAKKKRALWWLHILIESISFPYGLLQRTKRQLKMSKAHAIPNLLGDTDIEWSWLASQMPSGPGEALVLSSGGSHHGLIAAQRGFKVTAVDLKQDQWPYVHPEVRFIRGDILKLPLPANHFDLIINCSTVERVGLAGRYGVNEDRSEEDLEAMTCIKELMKCGGIMLLIVPVGKDAVFAPFRVYGTERLPRLLEGFTVEQEVFWVKDSQNRWIVSKKDTALNSEAWAGSLDPLENFYGLGCFVLKRS